VLLPYNPGSELAHVDNPELVLMGRLELRAVARILGNFYARCCTGVVWDVLSPTSVIAPHCSAQEHAA
jgi:hypothetical protein